MICSLCPICFTAPGAPHAQGCPVPGHHPPPQPTTLDERRSLVEAVQAGHLEAWLRGAPLPLSGGYRPPDAPEFP